jgi:folate-dependent phosphoribosylglycinamide formyltransferase PurN
LAKSSVLLLIDESAFFLPTYVNELIDIAGDIVNFTAIVVMKPPIKGDIKKNLLENVSNLTFLEVIKLILRFLGSKIATYQTREGKYVPLRSVCSTLTHRKVTFLKVYKFSELAKWMDELENCKFEILVSSNSMILKDEWLKKFKLGALNRHSSLLPSYGGLWPVFHGAKNGEDFYGASVHIMTSQIDGGPVLAQRIFIANSNDTIYSRYSDTYAVSAELTRIAIEKLLDGNLENISNFKSSYFGKLNSQDFSQLRKQGVKFI